MLNCQRVMFTLLWLNFWYFDNGYWKYMEKYIGNVVVYGKCPLVNCHRKRPGQSQFSSANLLFLWAMFNSYASLSEGIDAIDS